MADSENMIKLKKILRTFADLIRQGEGSSAPIKVSEMRTRLAAIDISKFDISQGVLHEHTVVTGTTDSSTPATTLEYYEKLMTNFANKVRVGQEKLDVDDIST